LSEHIPHAQQLFHTTMEGGIHCGKSNCDGYACLEEMRNAMKTDPGLWALRQILDLEETIATKKARNAEMILQDEYFDKRAPIETERHARLSMADEQRRKKLEELIDDQSGWYEFEQERIENQYDEIYELVEKEYNQKIKDLSVEQSKKYKEINDQINQTLDVLSNRLNEAIDRFVKNYFEVKQ